MRKHGLFMTAMLSAVIISGCSDKEQIEKEQPQEEIEEDKVQEDMLVADAEEALPFVMPFTGEPIAEEITTRPIIATINNHPLARPQSGLAQADVIYEMLAEGDVTRFLALYQSEIPPSIGPVRSARSYFIDIAKGLDAFYIAHGYSPDAKSMLDKRVVEGINGMQYDGIYFNRSSERRAPHNSYISGENVVAGAEKIGASMLYKKKVSYPFYEGEDSVKIGTQASEIAIKYSTNGQFNSQYVFNAETKRYARFSANVETVDYVTQQPIELANVLFFEMPHQIIDKEGRRMINIQGEGNAFIFQSGMMREVKWKNNDGLLIAIEEDGSEVKLVPGQTWIHFVPSSPGLASSVTYTQ